MNLGTSLLVVLTLLGCSRVLSGDHEIARRVAEGFVAGNFQSALGDLHCPPSYSSSRCAEDRSDVERSLLYLSTELGRPSQFDGPSDVPYLAYNVSVTGGELPYWQAISPFDTQESLYRVEFPKYGTALVRVTLVRLGDTKVPEIYEAGVALPASNPQAKDRAVDLMIGLAEEAGITLPDGFEERLNREIAPSQLLFP
jgi:hypothetical protein